MASTSLNARISTAGAARAQRELRSVGNQARTTEGNVVDLNNGFNGTRQASQAAVPQIRTLATAFRTLAGPIAAISGVAVAVSSAIGGVTIAMANNVREQRNMAAVSGKTIEGFNGMSFAASQFGVTNEQLSDQFKDVNEKIGEFIATGGGGLQDYIDVMGLSKKAGMEFAQSVQNLSGQDALQLMINNMQSANKSAREMSFAVEGLASDLTKSLPLLLDNGDALNKLNAEFAAVTNPLSDDDVNLYTDLAKNVDLSSAAFRSLAENALTPTIKYVNSLAQEWTWLLSSMNEGTENQIASRMADIQDEIVDLTKEAENATTGWGRFKNTLTFDSTTEGAAKNRIAELKVELASLNEQLVNKRFGGPIGGASSTASVDPLPVLTSNSETNGEKANKASLNKKLEDQKAYNSESLFLTEEQYAAENAAFAFSQELMASQKLSAEEADKQRLDASMERFEETNRLIQSTGSALSSSLSSGFINLLKGAESAKDVALGVVSSVAESVIKAGIDILIQNLITDKLATAAFVQAKTAEASSTVAQAGLNAFAATAAIPVVGPLAAPAAAAAATGAASALAVPVIAAASARYQGGNLSAGQSSSIVEQGDIEILTPSNSSRIRTAQQMKSIMGENSNSSPMNVTIINQGSNTDVSTEQRDDGELIVLIRNTVSADLSTSNSKISKQLTSSTTAQRKRG